MKIICAWIAKCNADTEKKRKAAEKRTEELNTERAKEARLQIPDLNIRKGAGTNTSKTGKYTGVGVFTITEVKSGTGSTKGWGRLKSGAGFISLDYCKRV